MLDLLHQNRVSIRYIHGRVDKRTVLLAELLDVRVFFLGQLLDVLLSDDGHRQGNWQLIDNRNLNDELILEMDEE